jgi:beta-aspartyl-peptidase (threonine type)
MVPNDYFSTDRRRKNLSSMKIRELVGTAAEASEAKSTARSARSRATAKAISPPRPRPAATPTSRSAASAIPRSSAPAPMHATGAAPSQGTGKGEYFIRRCVGHEIASLIAYKGLSLKGRPTSCWPN